MGAVLTTIGVAACDSQARPDKSTSASSATSQQEVGISGVPFFQGRIQFEGNIALSASWKNDVFGIGSDSCKAIAQKGNGGTGHGGEPGSFQVPGPDLSAKLNGEEVTVSAAVVHYSGPGQYSHEKLSGGIGVSGSSGLHSYDLAESSARGSLTVNPDGSGTLTLDNVPDVKNPGPRGSDGAVTFKRLKGTIKWTCS
jgi:hypothetical protein